MVRYDCWLKELLEGYPSKSRNELIDGIYTFINLIKIKNPTYDSTAIPTVITDGIKHSIEFTDANDKLVGALTLESSSEGYIGVSMRSGEAKLSVMITDEGIPQTYSPHPFGANENQIVTIKHLSDVITEWYNKITLEYTNAISTATDEINTATDGKLSKFEKDYLAKIAELQNQIKQLQYLVNITPDMSTSIFGSLVDLQVIRDDGGTVLELSNKAKELVKDVERSQGTYIATAKRDGFIHAISRRDTTLSVTIDGIGVDLDGRNSVLHTSGRSKYGRGYVSYTFTVKEGERFKVYGCYYLTFRRVSR